MKAKISDVVRLAKVLEDCRINIEERYDKSLRKTAGDLLGLRDVISETATSHNTRRAIELTTQIESMMSGASSNMRTHLQTALTEALVELANCLVAEIRADEQAKNSEFTREFGTKVPAPVLVPGWNHVKADAAE